MDFFSPVALSKPAPNDVAQQALAVIAKGEAAMPWAKGMLAQASSMIRAGKWPNAMSSAAMGEMSQQEQWRQFAAAYQPVSSKVIRGEWMAAKAAGAELEANVAFWDGVYRVTAAVATLGLSEAWDKLMRLLDTYKAAREGTVKNLTVLKATAQDPVYRNTDAGRLAATYAAQLESKLGSVDAQTLRALGPLSDNAEARKAAGLSGLGAFPIVAGIAAGAVVAISAAVAYCVNQLTSVQREANAQASEVLVMRQKVLDELVQTGKISPQQWQAGNEENDRRAEETRGSGSLLSLLTTRNVAVAAGVLLAAGALFYVLKRRRGAPAA